MRKGTFASVLVTGDLPTVSIDQKPKPKKLPSPKKGKGKK